MKIVGVSPVGESQTPDPLQGDVAITALTTVKTVNDLAAGFLAAQDVRPSSLETYRRSLKRFLTWFAGAGQPDATRNTIVAYKRSLEASGLSPHTVSAYLVVVRLFFEWAERMHLFPNVARDVKGGKTPKGHCRDCLTVTQVRKLLDGAERSTLRGKRDFAVLNLLVRTGLRTIEIVRADLGDIRSDSGEAFLWVRGKGRDAKDEFVLLTEVSLGPINEYLAARGTAEKSAPLFASVSGRNRNGRLSTRSVRRTIIACFRDVGIDSRRLTTHSLRHTAITLALLGGASVQEVQLLARHSSINTTMLYAHNLNRVANAPERRIDAMLDAGG